MLRLSNSKLKDLGSLVGSQLSRSVITDDSGDWV